MAKGIFMSGVDPTYDDLPEVRYHFPRRYLRAAEQTVHDWILYYEPRARGGRMQYFVTARVDRIEADPVRSDHFYAYVTDYLEFPAAVPYRKGDAFMESALRKPDGTANKGLLGWAVHHIPSLEYDAIVRLGMEPAIGATADADDSEVEFEQIRVTELVARPYRDRAFSEVVRRTYNDTCLFTGIHLVNGGGSCEVEAAHIKPVADHGPDSVRNGLALSRTMHWAFDHRLLALEDDGKILVARGLLPERLAQMINPDGYARLPESPALRPHPQFLRYHREHRFRG